VVPPDLGGGEGEAEPVAGPSRLELQGAGLQGAALLGEQHLHRPLADPGGEHVHVEVEHVADEREVVVDHPLHREVDEAADLPHEDGVHWRAQQPEPLLELRVEGLSLDGAAPE